ncbi:MAG TPA: efflux RND transporter periplasmic adaptor subunit [Polyangiaceae bacterium]|nr:efflux RND transporter periplasmic adaptor subunit [Polyangiaceae bacterium]
MLIWFGVLGLAIPLAWLGRANVLGEKADGPASDVVRASARDLDTLVKATGVVKPMLGSEIRVGAQLTGVVRRLYVQTGEPVKRGQLLLELDARGLRAKRDQAAAAAESARANLSYAENDWQRQSALARSGVISAGALDAVERSRAVAKATAAEAQAQLAYARSQLADARVTSPMNGIVAAVNVQMGELVSNDPTSSGCVTIIDLERLEVWAYVDETDIGRVRAGQKVNFSVDTYPDQEYSGEVSTIYPKPEIRDNVVNYVAAIRFDNVPERLLRPEMTTNVRIILERREGVLTLPRRAVRRDRGQSYVLIPHARGAQRREVTLGSRDDNYVEVKRGLNAGDQILLSDPSAEASNQEQKQ